MLNIKKYSNGRFFDTAAKEYIKPEKLAEMIKKGEDIKVTLTKTGKDITETILEQFSKKEKLKSKTKKTEFSFLKTDKVVKWLGEVIETKIEKVMEAVKLPTREQVANLEKNIQELNKKIDSLKLSQEKIAKEKIAKEKAAATKKPAAAPTTATAKKTVAEDKKTDADPKK